MYMSNVEPVYSASEIANIVNLAPQNVRKNIKKLGIRKHSSRLVSGNETAFYLYESLPREWRFKIDDYEHKKERELWENYVPPPEKLALNDSAAQQAEAAYKQYQLDHAKTIQDQWERKEYFMVLFNSVRGAARDTAYAKDAILTACKDYLKAKGYENLGGAWNYKAVQEFCTAYVAGEVDIPEEHVRIISHKGKRSLTATSLLKWRDADREMGMWGLADHYVKNAGKTTLPALQQEFVIAMMFEFPHAKPGKVHKGLKARFAGAAVPAKDTVRRFMAHWKETHKSLYLKITDPDAWKSKYMVAFGSASADVLRLNQRWEADSTKSDVMCVDGRFCIIGIIDVWSRRLKLLVSPTSKGAAIAALLRRCIIDWGVPEEFRTDNGSDYASQYISRIMNDLEVTHHLCEPFSPEQKPHIERVFGTFSRDLVELLPEYIGHSVADRKQIESRKSFAQRFGKRGEVVQIALTSAGLQEFCDRWTESVYHQNRHRSLGMSPAAKARSWTEPVKRISNERILDVLLFPGVSGDGFRTVSKRGVEVTFFGAKFLYVAGELGAVIGERVAPFPDPTNMGMAVIYDATGKFLCIGTDSRFSGISQAEIAARAKAIQKEATAEMMAEVKKVAKKVDAKRIAYEILKRQEEQAAKIAELPKGSEEHGTAAIEEGAAALAEIDRKTAEPTGTPITAEELRKSDELLNRKPPVQPMTELEKVFEIERKMKKGTATADEIAYAEAFNERQNSPRLRRVV